MPPVQGQPAPPLVSRALVRVFVASFGGIASFFLLLSVVPLYASAGGAGDAGAGLTTGALLFATVAAELVTPRLMARFGPRLVLAAGLVLVGVPALALPASTDLAAILVICGFRGLGFGIVVVLGSALVASLVPAERRGEGLGLHGIVIGVPSVLALPFGVFLVEHTGYTAVFVAGAVVSLAGLAAAPGLPGRRPESTEPVGILAGMRRAAVLWPAVVFSVTALAVGVIVTFLPLAVTDGSGSLAALALLVQAVTSTASRWWAGRYGDRNGAARLLIPGLLLAAAGVLVLVLIGSPVAVLVGMVVFGAGFGVSQNASLAVMFQRVSSSGYGMVSALWNLAYDAGMGLGAVGFGVLAAQAGYPGAFALTAAVMLLALVPALADRSSERQA